MLAILYSYIYGHIIIYRDYERYYTAVVARGRN